MCVGGGGEGVIFSVALTLKYCTTSSILYIIYCF